MSTFEERYIDPLEQRIAGRMDALEHRIDKIEDTLNLVLKHLGIVVDELSALSRSVNQIPPEAQPGPYEYRPLDVSCDNIRLLAVYNSDNDDDVVTCRLVTASIVGNASGAIYDGEVTEYKTLSYAWGDPTATEIIRIDGHEFSVTQNLNAALRNIRKQNPRPESREDWCPTFWWIDAICINQSDISERSQQVNLMTRIYRKAAGVHIWLGEASEDSDLAMSLARQLGEPAYQGPGVHDVTFPQVSEGQRVANWKALIALLERSWWARVWVRQEVAVAKEAVVHCGNEQCNFATLAVTADILNTVDETLRSDSFLLSQRQPDSATGVLIASPYVRASVLAGFRSVKGKQPNLAYRDLEDLIMHTKSCAATDIRDKVFSMLGLLDPTVWELRADYRLSIKEVLMSAARCIILKKQSLNIMAVGQNPGRLHQLASWAPNLIDGWQTRPIENILPPRLGIVPAGEDRDFTFEGEDCGILKAKGYCVDVVAKICADTPGQSWSDDELTKLSATWKTFVSTAFGNGQGDFMDGGMVRQYLQDERAWIRFLSAGADSAMPEPTAATPLGLDDNHKYELVKSLLIETKHSSEQSSLSFFELKDRTLQSIRKFGVGRRLCSTKAGKDKGRVVLVPMDAKPGDEVWMFRGTNSAYVLRKIEGKNYVVVGEACKYLNRTVFMRETRVLIRITDSGSYLFITESSNTLPCRTILIH